MLPQQATTKQTSPPPIVSRDQGAKQLEEVMKNHAQLRTGVISKLQGGPLPVIYVVL